MYKKGLFGGIILVLLLGLMACNSQSEKSLQKSEQPDKLGATENDKEVSYKSTGIGNSTWIVYWDQEAGQKELEQVESLDCLTVFGVYFDGDGQFIIPDIVSSDFSSFKGDKYISFINDQVAGDGSSSLKDATLLSQLIGEENREKHVSDIISLAQKYKYDGIEIDYEAIKDDMELWKDFESFLTLLVSKARDKQLKIRVVLEPLIPFAKLDFPQGPEYVIMCYNLHGGFSEPGSKADYTFLQKVIHLSSSVSNRTLAFATGGFDWSGDKCEEVTEKEANALLQKYNETAQREKESGALSFSYTDEKNRKHTVYYADESTLQAWKKTAQESGIDSFSLWRLGGNQMETVKGIFQ